MVERNGWYYADRGKVFVVTQKGIDNVASYKGKYAGDITSSEDEAAPWEIENGYVEEVDDPEWIVTTGYEVVYDYNGRQLGYSNQHIFPDLELAKNFLEYCENIPWNEDKGLYITEKKYSGKRLKERKIHNGKPVYNRSWWFTLDAFKKGEYVDQEIINEIINCLPPACMRSDCVQLGEPHSSRIDEKTGKARNTFHTYKNIADDVWEFCGLCFRGENVERGEAIPYL